MAKDMPRRRKSSKPRIRRQESWRYVRVSESWRRPRGKTSRMRIGRRGWPTSPAVGYRSPREYRGIHPSGLREKLVNRPEELEGLSPEKDAVRIAATVGGRKRVAIIDQAQRLGLTVLNPKAPETVEAEAAAPPEEMAETPEASEPTETEKEAEEPKTVNQE